MNELLVKYEKEHVNVKPLLDFIEKYGYGLSKGLENITKNIDNYNSVLLEFTEIDSEFTTHLQEFIALQRFFFLFKRALSETTVYTPQN
jgi:hypothetical protein